jgi:hypothetical protein
MVNAILNPYHAHWPCECEKDDALASGNIDVLSGHQKCICLHLHRPTPLAVVCLFVSRSHFIGFVYCTLYPQID